MSMSTPMNPEGRVSRSGSGSSRGRGRTFSLIKKVRTKDNEAATQAALKAAREELEFFAGLNADTALKDLNSDEKNGLSTDEAMARLATQGPNKLDEDPPPTLLMLFLQQFTDPLVILLCVSLVVSAALDQIPAAVFIFIIVTANAVLGVSMEASAGSALEALKSMSSPMCSVVRDGRTKLVDAATIVPGDIVLLETGDSVPADIRLTECQELQSNEMALTGEPDGVAKDANFTSQNDGDAEDGKEKKLTDKNIVYMGCVVQDGRGRGLVLKTGMETKMGKIAELLNQAESGDSPLQMKLSIVGRNLGIASVLISVVVFCVGFFSDPKKGVDPNISDAPWNQLLLLAVSLTVAAVPEGLPVCVTISLAHGMRVMADKNALIKKLSCVETLGSASIICTDKTGTLTKGEMTAVRLWVWGKVWKITGAGFDPEGVIVPVDVTDNEYSEAQQYRDKGNKAPYMRLLASATLCSNAEVAQKDGKWEATGNSSERPLVVASQKVGIVKAELDAQFPRLQENPFNSTRKMMSTLADASNPDGLYEEGVTAVALVKGAPNYILDQCAFVEGAEGKLLEMTAEMKKSVLDQVDAFSKQAFRVLAVAYKTFEEVPSDKTPGNLENNLVMCGLVAAIDPERTEVVGAIERAARAGVRTVMITGDYVMTAKAIAENIGLLPRGSPAGKAVDCGVIREIDDKIQAAGSGTAAEAKHMGELDALTAYADVYARAKPEDKITIVRSLQRQGHVCSMTGDGVNDAPALKQAQIGVAMGIAGTDVAKGAADMILLDDNFNGIVEAIEEGRTIYSNIVKFCYFLLSTNVAEVFLILASTLMGLQSPLNPLQILWLNLATDGAPAVALAMEGPEPGIMASGPRSPKEPLIEKVMITGIAIQTLVLTPLVLGTYLIGLVWATGSYDGAMATGALASTITTVRLRPDQTEDAMRQARTMCIFVIIFAELLRAYGSRSMRDSVFTIGVFSNPWMQYATGIAFMTTMICLIIPPIADIFFLTYLDWEQWGLVLAFSWIPLAVDELTKIVYRRTGFGERPVLVQAEAIQEKDVLIEMKILSKDSAKAAPLRTWSIDSDNSKNLLELTRRSDELEEKKEMDSNLDSNHDMLRQSSQL